MESTTMNNRILLVEDDPKLSKFIESELSLEGYEVTVAFNGLDGLTIARDDQPDLVILDWMLPEISGLDVCTRLRKTGVQVPIIMLTAKDTEVDKVVGLELGADDYVVKPYSKAELVARIKAVLRRHSSEKTFEDAGTLAAGPVKIDIDRHSVTISGISVSLPLKEFELLEFLVRNSGRVLTRTQLIDRVWGSDYFGDTKTLDVHVKRLRAKIEKDPANPVYIQTIRGLGYKFEN